MKISVKKLGMFFLGVGFSLSLNSFELPIRYKPGAFNVTSRKNVENWVTSVDVRYGQSSSYNGYDGNAQRTSALDIFGPTNVVRLGFGLENLNAANMANTRAKWAWGYVPDPAVPLPAPLPAPGPLDVDAENFVKISGRVSAAEIAFNVEQNLFSGFFLKCYVPFRQLTVDKLSYAPVGSSTMPGGITVNQFFDTELHAIMREQDMEAPLALYKKQAVSEVILGVGWQGFNNKGFGVIDDATGRIFVGGIVPGAGAADNSYMVGFPLGYDGLWGVHARMELEVGIKKVLALGAATSASMFFKDDSQRRVMSDPDRKQMGLLSFAQTRVGVDQGAVWDVVGFVKLHRFFYGLVTQLGYSFAKQEETRLSVKDDSFLKNASLRFMGRVPPEFLNRDNVLNNDQRLQSWERQMLHFAIGYDFSAHAKSLVVSPYIGFQYGYPLDARRAMTASYLGGTGSLQIKMLF